MDLVIPEPILGGLLSVACSGALSLLDRRVTHQEAEADRGDLPIPHTPDPDPDDLPIPFAPTE